MNCNAKNRIRKRRYELLKEEVLKNKYTHNSYYKKDRNKVLSFLSSLCLLFSIALSVLIYGKSDENGKWIKENFGIELSFSKINKVMSKYTDMILNFDIFRFLEEDEKVSYEFNYFSLGNNMFESDGNEITSIGNGTVIFVSINNDENVIIIQHDLGYTATYRGLEDVLVKKYDRVDDKDVIGVSFEAIEINFEKNSEIISYEEVVEILS